jgi:hypothetical protein
MDYCSKSFNTGEDSDTVAAYNENLVRQSETLKTTWTTASCNVDVDAVSTPPSGINNSFSVYGDGVAAAERVEIDIPANTLTTNAQHMLYVCVKEDTAAHMTLLLREQAPGPTRVSIDFEWNAGVLQVKDQNVGTGSVTSLGGGWYRAEALVPINTIDGTAIHTVILYPSESTVVSANATFMTGVSLTVDTTAPEYQRTEARDGTSTNITLTTGGLTIDEYNSGLAMINEGDTFWTIEDTGTGYVRVAGDASGEGLNAIELSDSSLSGCLIGSEDPCFNTWATCQDTDYYNRTTKTYRWCEPRLTSKEQVSIDARPQIISVRERPPSKPVYEGIGTRASATVECQDEAHHDRGVDPYVADRSYTPEDQGTWWGKFRARNPYYNGRAFRILRGWAESDGIDLDNDFIVKHYILEGITGPDRRGRVSLTMKDILKLADDKRALCPERSTGVLDANITAVAAAATLSPSGIGDSEYPASGTIRIGSECMTFTRVADALTLTNRGTDGTTATTHSADDAVQLCYVVTSEAVDDVIYELLVTYAGIDSSYITAADWETEVDDWLSGHTLTGIVTEPTGVTTLVNEICSVYLVAVWWDEVNQKIRLKVTAPSASTWDTLTDDDYILRDSFSWQDDPSKRMSAPLVHWDQIDATENLKDAANYNVTTAEADTDAAGANEYGSPAFEERFSRWYTSSADASRLVTILLYRFRDNPKTYTWEMTVEHDYSVGDVVELDTRYLQDTDGSNLKTLVTIRQIEDAVAGHTRKYTAEAYSFYGRIGRWMGDAAPDYDAATDDEKVTGGWWADEDEVVDGDEPYRYA